MSRPHKATKQQTGAGASYERQRITSGRRPSHRHNLKTASWRFLNCVDGEQSSGLFARELSNKSKKTLRCLDKQLANGIYIVYTLDMETNIQKWGNSLGVRLPKSIALSQSLKVGSRVEVKETKTGISIEVVQKSKPTLDELLKNFDTKTQHDLVDWGSDVGKEVVEKW